MTPRESTLPEAPAPRPTLDAESAEWLRDLTGGQREAASARLHDKLLRIARSEVRRRNSGAQITGPELDDLAHQAAADALVAIAAELGQFRGDSRFTTWAHKFVMFEVSANSGATSGATPAPRRRPRTGIACRTASGSRLTSMGNGGTCSTPCTVPSTRP